MTMRITIKNEDMSRIARIKQFEKSGTDEPDCLSATKEIAPGESAEYWIYQERYLLVEEV